MANVLTAKGPEGDLFASVAAARFTEPQIATSKLSAILHPFQTQEAAEAALRAAGAVEVTEWKR